MKDEEVWAEVEGFPDYAVSNFGKVRSLRYDRILAPRPNSYGHHRVVLYRDGKPHDFYVHRLVARAFVNGYVDDAIIRHHDRDQSNLHVYNLRFASGRRLGRLHTTYPKPVHRRVRIVELDMVFRTIDDAARYIGGDKSAIYRVLAGRRTHHKGYSFEWHFDG